ncbi:Glycosyl hydrolases family 28 [Nonomuraea pusilla]|uniref:Glycosyl hydrolases family 28 n=2 Tax=Nonomuraea pusilla TaxID=46177 RepID=A0A1H8AB71_9ACTN|nr:Glycosyl hydrolases family 28 [Nonomuraea pusilla]
MTRSVGSAISRTVTVLMACLLLLAGVGNTANAATATETATDTATVTAYPVPAGARASGDFTVTANGVGAGVYDAGVNSWGNHVSFSTFDFSRGPVTVAITVGFGFSGFSLLPASPPVRATATGRTITFTLAGPANLSLVLDGDYQGRVLHLFAQAPESDVPSPTDPGVVFFPPGYHARTGSPIIIGSGQTLYLAPGAVLNARVRVQNATGARIMGHGVLMTDYRHTPSGRDDDDVTLAVSKSSDVTIDGVIANRSVASWTGFISRSSDVRVTNYHVVSPAYASTDAFDIVSSHDVTFDGVFVRCADDTVSIKGFTPNGYDPLANPADSPAIHNITYRNAQLWSDANNAMVVGEETLAASYSAITFDDIDVLYSFDDAGHPDALTDRAAMTVLMLNGTDMRDITFSDIRVNQAKRLIDLTVRNSVWFGSQLGNQTWPGTIHGVTFRNVTSGSSGSNEIRMEGFSRRNGISNVTLDNVAIGGRPVCDFSDPHLNINAYVSSVTIENPCASVTLPAGPVRVTPDAAWNDDLFDASHGYLIGSQDGSGPWSYQTWIAGVGFTPMKWSTADNRWHGTATYDVVWLGDNALELSPDGDQVLVNWTAPRSGTVLVTGGVAKLDTRGGDGVNVSIWRNQTNMWPGDGAWQAVAHDDTTGYSPSVRLTVSAGDVISFRLDQGGDPAYDSTTWAPRITYLS